MKWLNQVILILILALVGGWWYFYEIKGSETRETMKTEAKRLFPGLEQESVVSFEFQRIATAPSGIENTVEFPDDTRRFQFHRRGNNWRMTVPVDTNADQQVVTDLIDSIITLSSEKKLPRSEIDETVFGLDKPAFIIQIDTGGDDTPPGTFVCKLGNENPAGNLLYTKVDDHSDIYLIPKTLKDHLIKNVFHFRDKQILAFQPDDVQRISIQSHVIPSLVVDRVHDGWQFADTSSDPCDSGRIMDLLSMLKNKHISAVAAEKPDEPTLYGFNEPWATVSLTTVDGVCHQLILGNTTDESGKFRYAQRVGIPYVSAISRENLKKLPANRFEFISKEVCTFDRSEVMRFSMTSTDTAFEFVRTDQEGWRMISPKEFEADAGVAGSILSNLAFLRATGIKPEDNAFGETILSIQLFPDSIDKPLLELQIGDKPPDSVGRWVKTSQTDTVYRISDSDVQCFIREEFDFRNKELLPFQRERLDRIELSHNDEQLILVPTRDAWRLEKPGRTNVPESKLDGIYWAVHSLRMNAIITEEASDLNRYGLLNPDLEISVYLDGQHLGPLLLGRQTEDGSCVYATLTGSHRIVTVDLDSVTDLISLFTTEGCI
jgi:Domain of unknown function (DUF4340)